MGVTIHKELTINEPNALELTTAAITGAFLAKFLL